MMDTSIEILTFVRIFLKLVTEAASKIQVLELYIFNNVAQNWFQHFDGGDLSFEIKSCRQLSVMIIKQWELSKELEPYNDTM